jgi:hypothetical protein
MMVIVARGGLTYLLPDGNSWIVLNPADAVPQLSFGVSTQVSHAEISAVDFAEPYSQWRAPLAEADRLTLAGMLRSAWNALESDARAKDATRRRCSYAGQCACWMTPTCG